MSTPFTHPAVEHGSSSPALVGILAMAGQDKSKAGAILRRGRAPQVAVNPIITATKRVVVVKKPHTTPARVEITLSTSDKKFPRGGTLELVTTPTSGSIQFFDAKSNGNDITPSTIARKITAGELKAGFKLFAQASKPSANIDDVTLRLTLDPGPTPVGNPVELKLTAVELKLDISPPRASAADTFKPLPEPTTSTPPPNTTPGDKWFGGIVVNAQDPDSNQPRAQLVVQQVQPSNFAGELILQQVRIVNDKIGATVNQAQLFDDEIPGAKRTPKVKEKAKNNPFFFKADTIPSTGQQFFIEGKTGSATLREVGFQLGIRNVENDGDRVAFAVAVAAIIKVDSKIVVVKKPHTNPARRKITLSTSAAFSRKGTLKRSATGTIKIFDKKKDGAEIDLTGAGHDFTSDELKKGVEIFAEATTASGVLDDYTLTFTLEAGTSPVGAPATQSLTAFDFTLDICEPRTAAGVVPPALSLANKANPGRFLQLRTSNFTHPRALLIIRPPKPAGFVGTLELAPLSSKVQIFKDEIAAKGQKAETTPFTTAQPPDVPANGIRFFAEGASKSTSVRDTGFRLGVKGVENVADQVVVTVFDLAITNNVAPFETTVNRVQIEGILNRDRTSFNRSKLFLKQADSLFRVRLDMPGITGNTVQVRLLGVLANNTNIETQDITLTRTTGDRFVSRQTMAITKDLPRADITFAAPQDIEVIQTTAAGTLRAEMIGTFAGTGVRRVAVRGRVLEMCTVVIQGAAPNIAGNLATANRVMAQDGIEFRILTQIPPINNPVLLDIAQTTCPLTIGGDNNRGAEETALFALGRAQCAANFIAYFVRSNSMGLNGCSAFPVGRPGVTIADIASQYTFCHETCHVLHLPHDGRANNLMTGNGTNNLPPNPRDVNLLPDQCQILETSGFIVFRE